MKVCVGAEDRAGFTDEDAIAAADNSLVGEMVEQSVPTEIFVPLLHFARDDVVKRAFGIPVAARGIRDGQEPPTAASVVPLLNDPSTMSLAGPAVTGDVHVPKHSTSSSDSSYPPQQAKPQRVPDDDGEVNMLDLDVSVNGGRFSVDGQVLRWWYPIPSTFTSPSSNPDAVATTTTSKGQGPQIGPDGKIEYTITIKRRGGAIDFKKLGVPENWVGMGPRTDVKKTQTGVDDGGRKGECCDGCVVQ